MERQQVTQETNARQRFSGSLITWAQDGVLNCRDVSLKGYTTGPRVDEDHYLVFTTIGYEETSAVTVDSVYRQDRMQFELFYDVVSRSLDVLL